MYGCKASIFKHTVKQARTESSAAQTKPYDPSPIGFRFVYLSKEEKWMVRVGDFKGTANLCFVASHRPVIILLPSSLLPSFTPCNRRRLCLSTPGSSPSLPNPALTSHPGRRTPVPPARCGTPLAALPWCPWGLERKRFARIARRVRASPSFRPRVCQLATERRWGFPRLGRK